MSEQCYFCNGRKIQLKRSVRKQAFKIENVISPSTATGVTFTESRTIQNLNGVNFGDDIFLIDTDLRRRGIMPSGAGNDNLSGLEERLIFDLTDGTQYVLKEELIVKFKDSVSNDKINNFISGNNFEKLRKLSIGKSVFVLKLLEYENALDQINSLIGNSLIDYAEPNFKRIQKRHFIPDETEIDKQWYIKADNGINLEEAWDLTKGKKNIVIAIIDDGIDYFHEDLNVNGKLKNGFNIRKRINNPNPVNNEDYHGTFCAGLAAASQNDKGISGVAPGCSLMGVKVADSVRSLWNTENENLAEGIQWAVDNGADIISCSWGGGDRSDSINLAIENAKSKGRDGKGCIICVAAGNYYQGGDNFDVLYPGNLKNVLTIAACNQFSEWKSFSSSDNDDSWGSRYGVNNEIDLCAPGQNMVTTDIMGPRGSNGEGSYAYNFKGTSASTPIVAGVAALMLSVNNNLTSEEVELILKENAEKLYAAEYEQKTGFGRVNASKSVKMAKDIL